MTAQSGEVLLIDGKECRMAFCPPLPENDPRVVENDDTEQVEGYQSTACWRGYVAGWEIKEGKFYLIGIGGRFKMTSEEPIFADWFTGSLRIPEGELLHYVHQGFGSVYERERHFKIENGIVIKSRTIDNRRKKVNDLRLRLNNLPGGENRFDGDSDW